jgi:hypothetical protein
VHARVVLLSIVLLTGSDPILLQQATTDSVSAKVKTPHSVMAEKRSVFTLNLTAQTTCLGDTSVSTSTIR